jgi:hypothetical protein
MTTYLAAAVCDQLDQAQAELEQHLVVGPDGRCAGCGQTEPCAARARLAAVFAQYGQLPERKPGLTRVGLRRIAATDRRPWFTG